MTFFVFLALLVILERLTLTEFLILYQGRRTKKICDLDNKRAPPALFFGSRPLFAYRKNLKNLRLM